MLMLCLCSISAPLAILCLAFSSTAAGADDDCHNAPIRTVPPTSEEWRAALGPDSSKVRIAVRGNADAIVVFEPKWDPSSLVAHRGPVAPDTLHIAWMDIARIENHVATGNTRKGMTIGAVLGVLVPFGIVAATHPEDAGWAAVLFPLTVPLGIILGGSIAHTHEWTPVLCDPTAFDGGSE